MDPPNYNPEMAETLVAACQLTYKQNENGPPPKNDGAITPPAGYTQVASFTAPNIGLGSTLELAESLQLKDVTELEGLLQKDPADLIEHTQQFARVYFGFALTSNQANIIALRGTQSIYELILDISFGQWPFNLPGFDKKAKVHFGFFIMYLLLKNEIIYAIKDHFNPNLPCYITGHSLGSAVATLIGAALKLETGISDAHIYAIASPRVGNPDFVNAYNALLPNSFRIVNYADVVTIIPPRFIGNLHYEHIGTAFGFLNQNNDIRGNHEIHTKNNYKTAINLTIPSANPRQYPTSCLT